MYLDMYNINDNAIKFRIANFLDDVFSLHEVEMLIDDLNRIDLHSKREIKLEKVEIYRTTFNNLYDFMIVNDILNLNIFPAQRYLEVIIKKKNKGYRFKLKYDKNLYINLIEIFCRTYNMIRYKSSNSDASMTNYNILNNYAYSLAKILPNDKEFLDHIRYISNDLYLEYKKIKSKDTYFKVLKITDEVNIEIVSKTKYVIKFQVNVGGKRRLIYLDKSIIGIHNIQVIVNKMYKYKKKYRRKS